MTVPTPTKIRFFNTPADLRKWLAAHHQRAAELWVGFYRKDSGRASITWPEAARLQKLIEASARGVRIQ